MMAILSKFTVCVSLLILWSCGPPHMDVQEWDDQHELTYSSYVRTRDVTLKTCRRRWMIGRNGKRRSGISALAARHDDDDEDKPCFIKKSFIIILEYSYSGFLTPFLYIYLYIYIYIYRESERERDIILKLIYKKQYPPHTHIHICRYI